MRIKSIKIGNTELANNVFLAPMAGYTDYSFRTEILNLGAGLCFTELVSAKGLFFGGSNNSSLIKSCDYEKNAVQIFGAEEYYMQSACESDYLRPFSIVDINMGCPVPKVYKNGEGSALLKDVIKAEKIVKACVKSGKNITVKIRTGLVHGDDVASEFAQMAENVGAKMITVHGRVREDYYSGEPDFNAIEKAKNSVKIPVIANGGIFTEEDAENMIDKTGADGVMIARGALSNPFIFSTLTGKETDRDLKSFIIRHVKGMLEVYPDRRATVEFRKFVPHYFKGMKNAKELKEKLYKAENTAEIISTINNGF